MSRPCAGPCWPCVNCSEGCAQCGGKPRVMGCAPSRTNTSKLWRGPCRAVRQRAGGGRPGGRKAAGEGVRAVAHEPLEIVARTVSRIQAFAFGDADYRAAGADGDAFAERFVAPAEADHVVVRRPV